MIVAICGKEISVSDKNARAYEKMTGLPIDADNVRIYVQLEASIKERFFIDDYITRQTAKHISQVVNKHIEQEVRDCAGNKFYEEA